MHRGVQQSLCLLYLHILTHSFRLNSHGNLLPSHWKKSHDVYHVSPSLFHPHVAHRWLRGMVFRWGKFRNLQKSLDTGAELSWHRFSVASSYQGQHIICGMLLLSLVFISTYNCQSFVIGQLVSYLRFFWVLSVEFLNQYMIFTKTNQLLT